MKKYIFLLTLLFASTVLVMASFTDIQPFEDDVGIESVMEKSDAISNFVMIDTDIALTEICLSDHLKWPIMAFNVSVYNYENNAAEKLQNIITELNQLNLNLINNNNQFAEQNNHRQADDIIMPKPAIKYEGLPCLGAGDNQSLNRQT